MGWTWVVPVLKGVLSPGLIFYVMIFMSTSTLFLWVFIFATEVYLYTSIVVSPRPTDPGRPISVKTVHPLDSKLPPSPL